MKCRGAAKPMEACTGQVSCHHECEAAALAAAARCGDTAQGVLNFGTKYASAPQWLEIGMRCLALLRIAYNGRRPSSNVPVFESEVNMLASFIEIAQQARQLQPEERARLAEMLLASLQEPMPSDIAAAWNHEVAERVAVYEAGSMESFPAEDVFAEAKRVAR